MLNNGLSKPQNLWQGWQDDDRTPEDEEFGGVDIEEIRLLLEDEHFESLSTYNCDEYISPNKGELNE